jgi:hypothetical protein
MVSNKSANLVNNKKQGMNNTIKQATLHKTSNIIMTQPSVIDANPYTPVEALAVARLIWALINSDQQLSLNESHYFQQSLDYLGVNPALFEEHKQDDEEKDYQIVRGMSSSKRSHCATLLRLAYQSDQLVDRIALSTLNDMLTRAELFRSDTLRPKRHDEGLII